jgi:hypothetical protein
VYPVIADYIYREYFDPNYGFKSLPSSKDYLFYDESDVAEEHPIM